jgi:hypothetical protein
LPSLPPQTLEVNNISARMAYRCAKDQIAKKHEKIKGIWFEYRELKARRRFIEAGQTTTPKPYSS